MCFAYMMATISAMYHKAGAGLLILEAFGLTLAVRQSIETNRVMRGCRYLGA